MFHEISADYLGIYTKTLESMVLIVDALKVVFEALKIKLHLA